MSFEYIVISELVAVLIIISMIGIVMWRDKSREIKDLRELNIDLVAQIDAMQAHIDARKANQDQLSESYHEVDSEIQEQLDHALDHVDKNWEEMERLLEEHKEAIGIIDQEISTSSPDLSRVKSEVRSLEKLLEKSERKVTVQKKELATSKNNVKKMKDKMAKLSQRILSMGGLEVSERRLKKDKKRLLDRIEDLKSKYEDQRLISRNLQDELKVSFRASEVQTLRDDLKTAEEALKRVESEKVCIEQHFLELSSNGDAEELKEQLGRAAREIELLEQTVIELDQSST